MPGYVEGVPFELGSKVLLAVLKHIHIDVPATK
jgi:hypothetical protein